MMKRIFGLLVVGSMLCCACSPILKYGKYSYKCRGIRGPYECSYITVNPDSTFHRYVWYDVGGGTNWTGKWSRIGNTLYTEQTIDSQYSDIVELILPPPARDTFIIKKNRLMLETQKVKWKKGEYIYKNSKTRFKYKFVPAEN